MDRHTESLIYTKCPKTLRDKKESTPSSVSQPPRGRAIDPIETRPDRSDPSSATIARARATTARRRPTHRAREKTIRPRRASTARPRRRVVVASSRSRSPIAHPSSRETARPRRGLQKLGLISRVTTRQTRHTLAVSVAGRTTARATRSERRRRRTPDDATVVSHRSNAGKRKRASYLSTVPLLLSLLGGRLDGDRRGSLDGRGRDDKHSICFFRARVCRRE